LADFGIARRFDDISGLTTTNMTVGTVAYSAPEQLMGGHIDGRADQYALAAAAYHLLTGSQLFPHSNPAVVISRHLNADPPGVAGTRSELAGLDAALSRALSKDPANRFDRCVDFARALAEQTDQTGSPHAAPTTPAPLPPRSTVVAAKKPPLQADSSQAAYRGGSRRRWMILVAAVVAVMLAAAAAGLWRPWEGRRALPSVASPNSPPPATATAPTSTTPPPPPPPRVFPASAIDTVLLTPAEINTLAASPIDPLMQIRQTARGMLNNSNLVTPPSCAGVIFTAERAVFAGTGFEAMLNQTLEPSGGVAYNATELTQVQQSVVVYPHPNRRRPF
jgi:serine/threonine-protein kinase